MFRRFSIDFAIFSICADLCVVVCGLITAALGVPASRIEGPFVFSLTGRGAYSFATWKYIIFPILWVVILFIFSVYDGRKHFKVVDELNILTIGSLLAMVTVAGLLYLAARDTARSIYIVFALSTYIYMVVWRLIIRIYFRILPQNGAKRHILILGAGVAGREMEQRIKEWFGFGMELIGFMDDDPQKQQFGNHILGPISKTVEMIQKHHVEEVILALPSTAFERINQIVSELHKRPVKVWVIPDYYHMALNKARMEEVAGLPMIDLKAPMLNEYQLVAKRIFDLTVTILLLPILLPVMAIVGIIIYLDAPGPIIYRSKRVGENGRLFVMYKFRTMYDGAERQNQLIERLDENGKIYQEKRRGDPRVTRFGKFLRKSSLDELPQIFNVLRGEMSLIGPRPELPHLVDQYELWQRGRFGIPQGITGWWQVNGRSDRPMQQHIEDDLYYIQHYSIWLDMFILLKTMLIVLRGKGAY